jgi:ABC-type Fe3+-siderophore transport system permease subunit
MHHQILIAGTLLAVTADNSKHFHIGPWIIVPILILVAIIGTPIFVIRDRRKRRSSPQTR